MSGPLAGVRIIELAGLGPAPFAGMMLADAGADIIRIDRADRTAESLSCYLGGASDISTGALTRVRGTHPIVAQHVLWRARGENLPSVEHDQPVTGRYHHLDMVLHQHDAHSPFGGQRADEDR